MGLRIWNELLDNYDHEQLADNWAKVDAHDHSPGRGVLIPTQGIAAEAVTAESLAASVLKRLLPIEVKYEGPFTALEAVPKTPSVTRNTIIVGEVNFENTAAKVDIEVKSEGKKIFAAQASKSTDKVKLPVNFWVAANQSWEWKKIEGTLENFTYWNVIL